MSRKPFRYQGRFGSQPDPKRCAASVSHGRGGVYQCQNARKEGSDWCGTHEPKEAAEDAALLWIVEEPWGYNKDEEPKLVSTPILKETKKQIVLNGKEGAFRWRTKIGIFKGKLEMGARSAVNAAGDYLKSCEKEVEAAEAALAKAQEKLVAAKALMDKTFDEHNPS